MKSDPRAPLLLKGCYTLETTYAAAINAVLKFRHLIIQKLSLEGRQQVPRLSMHYRGCHAHRVLLP